MGDFPRSSRVESMNHHRNFPQFLSRVIPAMASKVKQEIVPLATGQEGGGGIRDDGDEGDCRNAPQVEANETEPVANDGDVQQDGDVAVEEAEAEDSEAARAKGEHPAGDSSGTAVADKVESDGGGGREAGGGSVDHCPLEEGADDDELVAAAAGEDPRPGAPATGGGAGGSNDGGIEDVAPGAIQVVAPVAAMRAPGDPEHPSPLRHSSPRGGGGGGGGEGGGGGGFLQHMVSTPPRPEGRGGTSTSKKPLSPSSGGADDQSEELVACQTPPRIEGRPSSSHAASAPLCESAGSDGAAVGELGMSEAWNARLQCSTSVDTLSKEGRLVDLQSPAAPAAAAADAAAAAAAAAAQSPPQPGRPESRHSWDEIPINKLGMPMQQENGTEQQNQHQHQQQEAPPLEARRQRGLSGSVRSFTLLDQDEALCVDSEEELCRLLSCHPDTAVKVVSIFGNTGDGKSYAMNHTFFCGDDIFETSERQESCTMGAWAAYDPTSRAIVVDTEGMQAVSSNEHQRLRLLLKVMAISDVVIFCTKAERLHQDMFLFLEDASASYCSYFSHEIQRAAARTGCTSGASVGPHLLIHHETRNTQPLGEQSYEALVHRFRHDPSGPPSFPVAYSDVDYIGVKFDPSTGTDFSLLKRAVGKALSRETVRVHRPPAVVYGQLSALTRKFKGDMAMPVYGILPDLFFRCPLKCLSCGLQCCHTVGHEDGGGACHFVSESSLCTYSARFDNVELVCQACIRRGRRSVVAKEETRVMGVLWGHSYRCNECGIVHGSSLINSADKERLQKLRSEYVHVWNEGGGGGAAGRGNAGRQLMEQVMSVASSVAAVTEGPVRDALGAVKTWSMPTYWVPDSEIFECAACGSDFSEGVKKHHCRACGQGFCDGCTSHRRPVPDRGWMTEVRVCGPCNSSLDASDAAEARSPGTRQGLIRGDDEDSEWGVIAGDAGVIPVDRQCQEQLAAVYVPVTGVDSPNLPRRGVESISAAAEGVSVYLRGTVDGCSRTVANMVAPDYWEKDDQVKSCCVCSSDFTHRVENAENGGPDKGLAVHHCRCCGKAACDACSRGRRPVPSKKWNDRVRVCDTCNALPDPL